MTIYNVSNSTQLNTALGKAVGGDTIVLAAGNYGGLSIYNKNFSSTVTIKSASSAAKAHIDTMMVSGVNNLRFEGLDVGRGLKAGEPDYTQLMRVQNSNGVQMINMSIHGSLDNNPANDGMGLYVTNSSNVQLIGSSFRDLFRGAYFEKNTNVNISGNSFKMIRSDGIDVGAVNNITIDKNTFSDFHPQWWDHPDAIQFWQVNYPTGSSNITITNNVVLQGGGSGSQGIWISDPNSVGYSNVLIQNNLLYGNGYYHGISVAGGHGVKILNNTVLSSSADNKTYWIQLASGDNFVVKDNVTDKILVQKAATGLSLSHNLDLSQAPASASLIPNRNAPSGAHDLIVAGYGYHAPGSSGGGGSGGGASGGGSSSGGGAVSGPPAVSAPDVISGPPTGSATKPMAPVSGTTGNLPSAIDLSHASTAVSGPPSTSHSGASLSPASSLSAATLVDAGSGVSGSWMAHHRFEHFVAMA